MLSVTNLVGLTEAINKPSGFEMDENTNGEFVIRFTSLSMPNNPGHDLIEEEAVVEIDGYDFRIKQLKETKARKEVVAISTFYDLSGVIQDTIFGGTRDFHDFASFALRGTGWSFINEDLLDSRLIANFGEDNVIKLIQALCAVYECEYQILPDKYIKFSKEIGGDYDAQYRYKHNVKALSRNVDTTKLRTRIKGYGAEGLEVTYTSPNHTKFGISDETPVRDDQFATSESMLEHLKRTLIDYPEASFEMDTVELTDKELGERVWLIYEPLSVEFKTRILSRKRVLRNGKLYTKSVVLGNTVPRTLTDILVSQKVEIDENAKEIRSRFHQTNDLILAEVEAVNDSIGQLKVQANEISLSVTAIDGRVGQLTVASNEIKLSVTNVTGRLVTAEASIQVQAESITQKVSKTDFNGNTVASMINQDATTIAIQASKINLTGMVTIDSLMKPGAVTISEGNIVSESYSIGRGTGNPILSITASQGSHKMLSADSAGFRIESTGTLSLQANNDTIYANSKFWAKARLEVSGLGQFNNDIAVAGNLTAASITLNGAGVVNVNSVQSMIDSAVGGSANAVQWVDTYRIQRGGASLKFLANSPTIQARNYWDSTFAGFEGLAYSNVSRRELKKDISSFDKSALRLVEDTTIYNYRYSEDHSFEPKRIGMIFDEAPMEVMDFRGGVDIYAMASVLWKSVQELSDKVKKLQKTN